MNDFKKAVILGIGLGVGFAVASLFLGTIGMKGK